MDPSIDGDEGGVEGEAMIVLESANVIMLETVLEKGGRVDIYRRLRQWEAAYSLILVLCSSFTSLPSLPRWSPLCLNLVLSTYEMLQLITSVLEEATGLLDDEEGVELWRKEGERAGWITKVCVAVFAGSLVRKRDYWCIEGMFDGFGKIVRQRVWGRYFGGWGRWVGKDWMVEGDEWVGGRKGGKQGNGKVCDVPLLLKENNEEIGAYKDVRLWVWDDVDARAVMARVTGGDKNSDIYFKEVNGKAEVKVVADRKGSKKLLFALCLGNGDDRGFELSFTNRANSGAGEARESTAKIKECASRINFMIQKMELLVSADSEAPFPPASLHSARKERRIKVEMERRFVEGLKAGYMNGKEWDRWNEDFHRFRASVKADGRAGTAASTRTPESTNTPECEREGKRNIDRKSSPKGKGNQLQDSNTLGDSQPGDLPPAKREYFENGSSPVQVGRSPATAVEEASDLMEGRRKSTFSDEVFASILNYNSSHGEEPGKVEGAEGGVTEENVEAASDESGVAGKKRSVGDYLALLSGSGNLSPPIKTQTRKGVEREFNAKEDVIKRMEQIKLKRIRDKDEKGEKEEAIRASKMKKDDKEEALRVEDSRLKHNARIAKEEAAKVETLRLEEEARIAKEEAAKVEALRLEEEARIAKEEAAKVETLRLEEEARIAKEEAAKVEAFRLEEEARIAKEEAAKVETLRLEEEARIAKEEAAKVETLRLEEEARIAVRLNAIDIPSEVGQSTPSPSSRPDLAHHARSRVLSDSESSGTENDDDDDDNDDNDDHHVAPNFLPARTLRPPSLSPLPENVSSSLRPPSLSPSAGLDAAEDLESQYSSILKDTRAMKQELASRSKTLTRKLSNVAIKAFSKSRSKQKSKHSFDDDWSAETTDEFPKSPSSSITSKSVVVSGNMGGEEMEAAIIEGITSLQEELKSKKKKSKVSSKIKSGMKSWLRKSAT
ncbi:hypothetical protein TrCOL_g8464 [Triparma columacea]|uniref:Uncharacterized protein n=1 Tax=Triparma columacea TaxID=722753 RepID=A0A9W7L4R8_9STRA|nr:hypothetical protein TrCOL_g8464 [Triparma columacea]